MRNKSVWHWTMMIMVPDWIGPELHQRALDAVKQKNNRPGVHNIRVASYHEGLAVQIIHLGSYEDEAPVLARLHQECIHSTDTWKLGNTMKSTLVTHGGLKPPS